jgi:hypothetical protein
MNSADNRKLFRNFQVRQLSRLSGRCRSFFTFCLIYALILSQAAAPVAFAQTVPQPGQTDPVSNYALLPSDSLATFIPGNNTVAVQGYRSGTDLQLRIENKTNLPTGCRQGRLA